MITREKLAELNGLKVEIYAQYNWKYDFMQYSQHKESLDDTYITIADPIEITLKVLDVEQIVGDTVEGLKAELARHRAEAEIKDQAIQDQINNLLALPAPVVVDDDGIPF